MTERWATVAGYEGRYEVSDFGRVRSLPRKFQPAGKVLRTRPHRDGYRTVALYDGVGNAKTLLVHRLVALAFLGAAPDGLPDINHDDGNKVNNHFKNLEWSNDSLNVAHAFRVLGVKHATTRPWLGKFDAEHHGSKPVIRIASSGEEKAYPSVMAAGRDGFNFKHVSAVCLGKRQRHGGFSWRFAKEQS